MWSSGKCGAYLLSYVQRGVEMSISSWFMVNGGICVWCGHARRPIKQTK